MAQLCTVNTLVSNTNDSEPLALPLDAWHRARGARMVPFAGYAMPIQYTGEGGGIIAEHLWTREQAGLFDVSHMGQLVVSGSGAEAALEALFPADLAALKLGNLRYSVLLNDQGGILDDVLIARWPDSFAIVVNGATKHDDIAHIRATLPAGVALEHRADHCLLALQGPQTVAALTALGAEPAMPQIVPVGALTFMQMGPYRWNGIDLGISRTGYTGEDGFEISVHADHVVALADALVAHPAVRPIGLGARDSLRLEAGLPLYGHDMNANIDPISASLGFAISKRRRAEGGFAGADQVLALLAKGAPHSRVGLKLDGRLPAREGAEIYYEDQNIGTVTSGGFSPSLQVPIAMGLIETAHATLGTPLEIDVRGKRLAATVSPLPFIPHRYVRKGAA